jgi:hypothetical protein
MSKIKADLLKEISKKANKMKERRTNTSKKSLEESIFSFLQFIEESRKLYNNNSYPHELIQIEKEKLELELKHLDKDVKITVEQDVDYNNPENEGMIRGITVWWSLHYISQNKCDPSIYFDVTNILLGGL